MGARRRRSIGSVEPQRRLTRRAEASAGLILGAEHIAEPAKCRLVETDAGGHVFHFQADMIVHGRPPMLTVTLGRADAADLGESCGRPWPPDGSRAARRRPRDETCARSWRDR